MDKALDTYEREVLIVDDAGIIRVACERALQRKGYEVRTAQCGTEALDALVQKTARAVLMDLKMPVMNGLECMRVLKRMWPTTEIIIMTSYSNDDMVGEAGKLGAHAVMIKPFDDVRRVVKTVGQAAAKSLLREGRPISSEVLLGEILLESGWISGAAFEKAKIESAQKGSSLREELIANGATSEDDLDWATSSFLEIPFVHVNEQMLDPVLIGEFPLSLMKKYLVIPLFIEDGKLHMVSANPFRDGAEDEIEKFLDKRVVFYKGSEKELRPVIEEFERGVEELMPVPDLTERIMKSDKGGKGVLIESLFKKGRLVSVDQAGLKSRGDGKIEIELKAVLDVSAGKETAAELEDMKN